MTATDSSSILTNILEQINKSNIEEIPNLQIQPKKETQNIKKGMVKNEHKGNPKSGRFWKTDKKRFSTNNKNKGLKMGFKKKTTLRLELQRIKQLSKELKEQKQKEMEMKKERRRENLKRREENKRKSEIVQVITNTSKLKRMRKKQLRFIEKRDTNDIINYYK